jgi:tight adherence protein C
VASFGILSAIVLAALAGALLALSLARVTTPLLVEARAQGEVGWARHLLRRLAGALDVHLPGAYLERLAAALVRAGEPHRLGARELVAVQVAGGAAGLLVGGALALAGAPPLLAPALLLLGALLPLQWLRDRVRTRQRAIVRALPYTLDLLTLSVEAGLDFAAGIARVVERGRPGPLRDELALVQRQLRLGKTREDALRALMDRVAVPGVSSFVRAVIQADRMGTRLGGVLRIQSSQLRQERSMRAEKLAAEAPVKMLFPLLACIFPTVFLILFGPILFAFLFGGG